MANWKEDLVNEFEAFDVSPSPVVVKKREPRVIRKKNANTTTVNRVLSSVKENNMFVLPLFLLICILSIALVSSYNFRKRGDVYAAAPPPVQSPAPNARVLQDYQQDALRHQERMFDQQRSEWQAERSQFEDQAEVAIRETWGRTKTNRERVTLLGILYNNNMAAMRAGSRDYIFINPDWTISRYPNHLNLDEEDREFLSKFVKK